MEGLNLANQWKLPNTGFADEERFFYKAGLNVSFIDIKQANMTWYKWKEMW
jgi:hypothetical protein